MATDLSTCTLFRISEGECADRMPNGTVENIDPDCDPSVDLSQYKYYGELDSNGDTLCLLWKKPVTDMNNLILPGIVFIALCILLFIMIFKSVKERAAMRAAYEANYRKIQTSATAEVCSDLGRSRIPHSQFSCGGMTLTFQVSSNMNTPSSGKGKGEDPLKRIDDKTQTAKV